MKKYSFLIALLIFIGICVVFIGCNKLPLLPSTNQNNDIEMIKNGEIATINLIAGQNTVAGNVTITNDEEYLYVTYNT